MKFVPSLAVLAVLSLAAGSAAAFNLGEAARAVSGITGNGTTQSTSQTQALGLIGQLDELGVTPAQALGGSGALLQLAKQKYAESVEPFHAKGCTVCGSWVSSTVAFKQWAAAPTFSLTHLVRCSQDLLTFTFR